MWDDFPPIYVPSFAMLQSSIPYTIEAPLQPGSGDRPGDRAAPDIDTDVHEVAIKTSLKYIQDQPQPGHLRPGRGLPPRLGRRAAARHPGRLRRRAGARRTTTRTTFPRSYVIPAGARQRSAPAVKRLVDLLIASGGRVTQAKAAFTAGGNTYPAGSYILDMHQPKRGIVNSLLEPGIDITDRVDDLYAGPGGWSQALTWGATVDTLWDALPGGRDRARASRAWPSAVLAARHGDLLLDPQDAEDLLAINALLDQGVKRHAAVRRLGARARQRPRARPRRRRRSTALTFKAAPASWSGATLDDKVVVAYNGGSEVRDTLAALGFEGRAVTATTLTTTLTSDVDVLLVGATLNPAHAERGQPRGATTRSSPAAAASSASARRARRFTTNAGAADRHRHGRGRASPAASPTSSTTAARSVNGAQPHACIFQPAWYSNLGANAVVEQSFAADPLLVGLVASGRDDTNGQAAAAGKASVVRAVSAGRQRRRPDRHQRRHPPARQGPAAAARPRDPVGRRARTPRSTRADGTVGGTVPATLSLTLGAPATFGAFIPGVANDYTASTTATVISDRG